MKKTLTPTEWCEKHDACGEAREWVKGQKTLAEAWENCERADWLIWAAEREKAITKPQAVKLACMFARDVLPLYEARYPQDTRPRQAIEAAEAWIANPTDEAAGEAAWAAARAAGEAAHKKYCGWIRAEIPNPWGKK